MKIRCLTRPVSSYQPAGSNVPKAPKNPAPEAHPFERAREYTRALNAIKLDRMFAAPFVGQLGVGHQDGVYEVAVHPSSLDKVASGSGDGVVKKWSLTTREELWATKAHDSVIKGVSWVQDKLLTCANDGVKLFADDNTSPIATWLGAFTSLSHHRSKNAFAASSSDATIKIFDLEKNSASPEVLQWATSTDTITSVCFNQSEQSILASTATDRSIVLYDLRSSLPLNKTILNFASNKIDFNPMEPFNFAVANEDHNVYLFDMRKMDRALNVLRDHVAAVMDVKFSPTGSQLASASYDRSIRLWNRDKGHSEDIYHTKRMQRCFAVSWTGDGKFVISGSDEGNVRLWRAKASSREGVVTAKQRQSQEYNAALVSRYKEMPEIRRIARHRHVPKVIKKAGEIKKEELKALKRREENRRKHSALKFEKRQSERDKVVLAKEK